MVEERRRSTDSTDSLSATLDVVTTIFRDRRDPQTEALQQNVVDLRRDLDTIKYDLHHLKADADAKDEAHKEKMREMVILIHSLENKLTDLCSRCDDRINKLSDDLTSIKTEVAIAITGKKAINALWSSAWKGFAIIGGIIGMGLITGIIRVSHKNIIDLLQNTPF